MNSVEIKNVSFKYGKNIVLDDVTFSIQKGSYTAILGQNGSGKSTIAKLIMSLLEPQKGDIFIQEKKLTYDNMYDLRDKIGIVFQNPDNQFIGATVRDDIAFGLENKCIDPALMDDIILNNATIVKMENMLDHEPAKLSGGQKQRVAIAGVLAMNPEIIILDEATSMLDPKGKKEVNELVYGLCKEKGITVISITHDIEEAANCDHIILLDKGKILGQGCPNEIFESHNMNEISLDIPFVLSLSRKLIETGIKVSTGNNIESLVDELCQLNSKM